MTYLRTRHAWMQRLRHCLDTILSTEPVAERALPQLLDALGEIAVGADAPVNDTSIVDRYTRIGLADSSHPRYSALAIVWPPGHASPVHDHAGLWGLEIVVAGTLEIDEYDILSPHRLRHRHHARLEKGQGAWFGGPRFAHACRNASAHAAALTLHVYGGDLTEYNVYDAPARVASHPDRSEHAVRPARLHAQRADGLMTVE